MKKTAVILCITLLLGMFYTQAMASDVPDGLVVSGVMSDDIMFTIDEHAGIDADLPDDNIALKPYSQIAQISIRTSDANATDDPIDKRVYYKMDLSKYSDKIVRKVILVAAVKEYKGGSTLYINPVTEQWASDTICYNNKPEYNADIRQGYTLVQGKTCELDVSQFVDDNHMLNIMLTCTHPSNANFSGGKIKSYTNLGGILADNIANRTYLRVVYTDDYLAPQAIITKLEGDNIQGRTLETDYAYYSYEGDPEGESVVEWLISESPDGEYEVIPGENEKTLTLTADMADKYIKSAVTPKSASGVYTEGERVISENSIGPIFGDAKVVQVIESLNACEDAAVYRETLEEYSKLFGILPSEQDEKYGCETVDEAISILLNYEVENPADLQKAFFRAIMLSKLNNADESGVDDIVNSDLFGLDIEEYGLLKDTSLLKKSIINRNFTSLEQFDLEFTNLLAYCRFKEADRTNIKVLLKKYDDIFDENISQLSDNLLSRTGTFLLQEDYTDAYTLNIAVSSAVSKARKAAQANNEGGGGSSSSSKKVSKGSSVKITNSAPTGETREIEPFDVEIANINIAVSKGDFDDLSSVPWAKEQIAALAQKGVVNGVGGKSFCPEANVTREEFAKMLTAAFDINDGESHKFVDVNDGDWYAPYIGRLAKSGIVTGISDSEFGVGRDITREEMAVMLCRALKLKGISFAEDKFIIFEDDNAISDYAAKNIAQMAYAGIIAGFDDGCFRPHSSATRAMAAVMISNAVDYMTEG